MEPKTLAELSNARRDLLRLLMKQSLATCDKGRHLHYVQANKCGKHLTQILHPQQRRQNIPYTLAHPNRKLHKNGDCFRIPRLLLHTIQPATPPKKDTPTCPDDPDISAYIQDTTLPMISASAIEDLEAPITTTDYLLANKSL